MPEKVCTRQGCEREATHFPTALLRLPPAFGVLPPIKAALPALELCLPCARELKRKPKELVTDQVWQQLVALVRTFGAPAPSRNRLRIRVRPLAQAPEMPAGVEPQKVVADA